MDYYCYVKLNEKCKLLIYEITRVDLGDINIHFLNFHEFVIIP